MKIHFLALSLITASSMTIVHAQQTPAAATATVNLAQGKKYVSSDPNIKNWGTGLTDGSWTPQRGTTFATGNSDIFPKTVTVDLEEAQKLGYVVVGVPPFGSTKTIGVSLSSDGATYTEVGKNEFAAAKEKQFVFNFQPVSARYVRLTYLDHYPEKHDYPTGYAFTTELAAYAPGEAPVISLTPAVLEPADEPAPKTFDGAIEARFSKMHESFLQRSKEGPIGALFIGDSITDRWRRDDAKDTWSRFAAFNPANFGIGGDKTQHVLWRFANGELDNVKPKVVVLMIGTNNLAKYSTKEIVRADTKVVDEIHRRLPDAKLLLLGIFPRNAEAADDKRAKIKRINKEIAKLDDGKKTRFLDIGDKFLEADGSISKEVMADALHPTPKGYQIWADAMLPLLSEMMQ